MGQWHSEAVRAGAASFSAPAAAVTSFSVFSPPAVADSTASRCHSSSLLSPSSFTFSAAGATVRPSRIKATLAEASLSAAAPSPPASTAATSVVRLRTAGAAAASPLTAAAAPPPAASAFTFFFSKKAAAAAPRRVAAGSQLAAAAAAMLALCVAAARAEAAAPYDSAAASLASSYWEQREGPAAPAFAEAVEPWEATAAGGASFEPPEEAAAGGGSTDTFSPPAAGAPPGGVHESYRRADAAAYEWYAPSAEAATPVEEADLRQRLEVPALYGLSFLHDFLNYATALLWFAAYAALLRRVCLARNIQGLSLQSLFALVWVEVSNVLLVICLSLYHRKPLQAEFFLIDVSSAAVSLFTFLYVSHFFGGSYEAERDNFGKQLTRFAALQPYSRKYYFVVLYLLSLCLAIPMFLMRRASLPAFSPAAPSPVPADAAAAASDAFARSSSSFFAAASLFSSSYSFFFPFSLSWSSIFVSAVARCAFYLLSFWECFNDTVLALALLPQLCMLYNKRPRRVASLLGTFVALLFFARVFAFFYWLTFPLFHNAYPAGRGIHLATEALNILLLSDFLYYYLRARLSGETDIALPL